MRPAIPCACGRTSLTIAAIRRWLSATRQHRAVRQSATSIHILEIHILRARKCPQVIGGIAAATKRRLPKGLMICADVRPAESSGMTGVRLIKHEAVPKCGSYEVRYPDGRPSRYFYFEDLPGRRLRPEEQLTSEQALEQAQAVARATRTA